MVDLTSILLYLPHIRFRCVEESGIEPRDGSHKDLETLSAVSHRRGFFSDLGF